MRQKVQFLSCVFVALLLLSVRVNAQKPSCFSGTLPSHRVMAGDTLVYDLDIITKMDNPILTVDSSAGDLAGDTFELPYTFFPNGVNEDLEQDVRKCDAVAQGLTDSDFVFLCDSNKVFFLSIENHSGSVIRPETKLINLIQKPEDSELVCDTIRNDSQNNVYLACRKPGLTSNIFIYTISLKEKVVNDPFVIEQPSEQPEQVISGPLKLSVDSYDTQTHVHLTLFIYERSSSVERPRFIILEKPSPAEPMKKLGYFGAGNEASVKDLATGKIITLVNYGLNVLFILKNAENKNLVQRCGRQLIEGVFTCLPETTLMEGTEGSVLKIYQLDPTLKSTKAMDIYTVTKDQIIQGKLDPEIPKYERVNMYNVKTSLTSITDVQKTDDSIFIFGPTGKSSDQRAIDGVVKFKVFSKSVRENSYSELAPTWTMARTNPYNNKAADLIFLSEKKYATRLVQRASLLISTSSWKDEALKRVEFSVKCRDPLAPESQDPEVTKFVVETLLGSTEETKITLKPVEAYSGSAFVLGSTSDETVLGNAPTLVETAYDVADSKISLKFETAAVFSNPELKEISGISAFNQIDYLGESIYALTSTSSVILVKCNANPDETNATCEKVYNTIDLAEKQMRFLKGEMVHGILTYVLGSIAGQDPRTVLYCINTKKTPAVDVFTPIIINAWSDYAEIKLIGSELMVFVIGADTETDGKELRYLKFEPEYLEPAHRFEVITKLQSHVCPTGLSWTPRNKGTMLLSSSCEKQGTDSHVYQVSINFDYPHLSQVVESYLISGTSEFAVCAQDSLINIVDYNKNAVYSFNRQSNSQLVLSLPLKEDFGLEKIKAHYCSQEDNALLVVACDKATTPKCKLITYRANNSDEPRRRVHSVVEVRNDIKNLASSFNNVNDDALTILLSTDVLTAVWSQLDGPHLLYDTRSFLKTQDVKVTPKITFQGEKPVTVNSVSQTLSLALQTTELKANLKDKQKRPEMDNSLVELENWLDFTGPYHKLQSAGGLLVTDRMPPSTLFDEVKIVWHDSILHRDFVFGYQRSADGDTLLVAQNNTRMNEMGQQGYSIKHLQLVAISPERFYFFALGAKAFKKDRIICIFTIDGGKKFESMKIDLASQGFQQNDIRKLSANGWFIFGGYDNEVGYTATSMAFKINDDGTEVHGTPYESHFRENIVDFELVTLDKNRAVMITALQYDTHAEFHLIKVDEKGAISLVAKQISTVTPLFEESHREVVFKCKEGTLVSTSFTCLMTGVNKHSYVSTFTLNIKDNHGMNDPFIQAKVAFKLRNVVNMRPVRADFYENHVAVLAENTLPLNKGQSSTYNSFFEDSHVVLVYKVDQSNPSMPIEKDVYRILDSTDIGVSEKTKLATLDPRFFRGLDSKARLGLNIGLEAKSLKVFSLDGLVAVLDKSKSEHKNFEFKFVALDRRELVLKASEVFNISDGKSEKKNPLLMLTIIAAIVLVVVIIITGIFYTRRSKTSGLNYDEGLDDVEKSMRNNEDSVGEGYKRA